MHVVRLAAMAAVLGLSAQIATADGPDSGARSAPAVAAPVSPWMFNFTTYGWMSWLNGNVTLRGRDLDMNVGPKQLINALDWSDFPIWMSYAEARLGKLSLFNDVVYAKVADSKAFVTSRTGRFGIATASLAGDLRFSQTQATVEFGGAYEIWNSGGGQPVTTALDVVAGARYWYQNMSVSADLAANLSINGPLGIVDLDRTATSVVAKSRSVDWVDPFVGLRLRYQGAPGQSFTLRGDVGGFGAGSDISLHGIATYDMRLMTRSNYVVDAYLGYKALYVDYSKGAGATKYEYDVLQHGPVTGLTVRF